MTKHLIIGGIVVAAMLFIFLAKPQLNVGAGVYSQGNVFSNTATSGAVVVTTDQTLLASSSERRFVYITPAPTCAQGAYISLNNDRTATAANSIFLSASSSFQIDMTNLYTGAIHAISNGGSCTLLVTAK